MRSSFKSRLRAFAPQKSFFVNVAYLAGGTAVGQAITVCTVPLITRLYLPEDLGRFGLFFTFTNIAILIASLTYETAIVSAENDNDAAHLTVLSLMLNLLASVLAVFILASLIQGHILGFQRLPIAASLGVGIALIFASAFNSLRYWLIRFQEFKLIASIVVFQNLGRSCGQILLGLLSFGWLGLLIGEVLGRSLGVSRALRFSVRRITDYTLPFRFERIKTVARQYSSFPKYFFPSVLINALSAHMLVPIIIFLQGEAAGGLYFMAQRLLAVPVSLISISVADVFHNKVTQQLKSQPDQVHSLLLKTSGMLFLLGIVPTVCVAIAGSNIFIIFAGEKWAEAGKLLTTMAPASLISLCVSPVSRLVCVVNGQRWKLIYDAFSLFNQGLIVLIGMTYHLSLFDLVALSSGLMILAYVIYFAVLLRISTKVGYNLTN